MATIKQKIVNCLWFNNEAEDAAKYYTSIFKNSKIISISRYGEDGYEFHRQKPGTAMVVYFTLDGQNFTGLNGGPQFKFSEAISLMINCETQEEIDYFWEKLSEGGYKDRCGWLKDKYGLSWQVIPEVLAEMMSHPDKEKVKRVTEAFMKMSKFDLKTLWEEFEK